MADRMSSEQIAKALKGAGLSTEQRIVTATEAWRNVQLFFPNKDDFLLDWLCGALTMTKTNKLSDIAALQIAYWELFDQLLKHYAERAVSTQKSPPSIRVPIISAVSAVFQHMHDALSADKRTEILLRVQSCLESLFSEHYALSYRPRIEHTAMAVDKMMDAFLKQAELMEQQQPEERPAFDALVSVANLISKRFDTQLIQAASQKRSFTMIVGKSFGKLLSMRRLAAKDSSSHCQRLYGHFNDILRHGLFHADNIMEYTAILKDTTAGQANYVSKLFEEMSAILQSSDNEEEWKDVLDAIPILFRQFVTAFRGKRGSASGQEMTRAVEFKFFIEAHTVLEKVRSPRLYLETLCDLLDQLVQLNVYHMQNSDTTKSHREFLDSIAEKLPSYLSNQNDYSQAAALRLANILLQIDIALIEGRMSSLWPYMLNPTEGAEAACRELAVSTLRVHAASRQLDGFIGDLLSALHNVAFQDVYSLLSKPIFSQEFLDEFSALIDKQARGALATEMFERFSNELCSTREEAPIVKKQKKKSRSARPRASSVARTVATLFAQFIRALKINQQQKPIFKEHTSSLFRNFVYPSLNQPDDIEGKRIPALQIHMALVDSLPDVYWSELDPGTHEQLARIFQTMFLENTKKDGRANRIASVLSANAILQHIYHVCLRDPDAAICPLMESVHNILDFIFACQMEKASVWSGSLLDVHKDAAAALACWKLVTDEWFGVMCRLENTEYSKKYVSAVMRGLLYDGDEHTISTGWTWKSLDALLLRSANFYEAKCFKDHSIGATLGILSELFDARVDADEPEEVQVVAKSIVDILTTKAHPNVVSTRLQSLAKSLLKSPGSTNACNHELSSLEKIIYLLLLFPTEYYSKMQGQQLMTALVLIDIWASSHTHTEAERRIRVLLLCRSLLLRFIAQRQSLGILATNPDILSLLLHSLSSFEGHGAAGALEAVTRELDQQVLRFVITEACTRDAGQDEVPRAYFKRTWEYRMKLVTAAKPNAMLWIIDILEVSNEYMSRKGLKQPKSSSVENSLFLTDSLFELSTIMLDSLEKFGSLMKEKDVDDMSKIPSLDSQSQVLTVASLLLQHAQLLGSAADKAVDSTRLSENLVSLASPITRYLQLTTRSNSINSDIVELITAFVQSLCTALSQHKSVYITERVFAIVWFVYSILTSTGYESYCEAICRSFSTWVTTLEQEQVDVIMQGFIELSNRYIKTEDDQMRCASLTLLTYTIRHMGRDQRPWLRDWLPILVQRVSITANVSKSLKCLHKTMEFLKLLTSYEQAFSFRALEASVIISCLLQAASPSAPERFQPTDRTVVQDLFNIICQILQNLLLHHRRSIVNLMPSITGIMQALLHCFRSSHLATSHSKKQDDAKKQMSQAWPLFFQFAPLNTSAADELCRTFTTIPAKTNTYRSDPNAALVTKTISRHAPYILIEYFTIQSTPGLSISKPSLKAALLPGLYELMDLCNEAVREFILASLNGSGKMLFKSFYTSWKEDHLYQG